MRFSTSILMLAVCLSTAITHHAVAQQPGAGNTIASPTEQYLQQSATDGKFTFILFYREVDAATQTMAAAVKEQLASESNRATMTSVRVDDAAEAGIVHRFGVSRAPMPMLVAVGPNGAMTGLFPRNANLDTISNAFVSPTMMQCMKHLQDGKLVFVFVHSDEQPEIPLGVQGFASSNDFRNRTAMVSMRADNQEEATLMQQMKLDGRKVSGTVAVLIAPPGVMVSHFNAASSQAEIAAAVHKAGKCCDDPNCKHGR